MTTSYMENIVYILCISENVKKNKTKYVSTVTVVYL